MWKAKRGICPVCKRDTAISPLFKTMYAHGEDYNCSGSGEKIENLLKVSERTCKRIIEDHEILKRLS